MHIKTEDICVDIANDVDTSNKELGRPFPKGKTNWFNERWRRWKNNDRVCNAETKTI